MQHDSNNLRPSVRDEMTDTHHNPLLTPAEQAHVDTVRAQWSGQQDNSHPTPPLQPETRLAAFKTLLAHVDWMRLYQYGTNAMALGFVGFYMVDFSNVATNGNHIYTVYRVFPVLAALGICLAMWSLPKASLQRVFYLVGAVTVSWLV